MRVHCGGELWADEGVAGSWGRGLVYGGGRGLAWAGRGVMVPAEGGGAVWRAGVDGLCGVGVCGFGVCADNGGKAGVGKRFARCLGVGVGVVSGVGFGVFGPGVAPGMGSAMGDGVGLLFWSALSAELCDVEYSAGGCFLGFKGEG